MMNEFVVVVVSDSDLTIYRKLLCNCKVNLTIKL